MLEFKKINSIYYPLSTLDDLGYLYPSAFSRAFTFIGKNNRIIGFLDEFATEEEIDTMIKRAIASFYGITSVKSNDKILLNSDQVVIGINNYISIEDGYNVELYVASESNPAAVSAKIIGRSIVFEKGQSEGFSRLRITAKTSGKEGYVSTDFEVINPTSLYDDFERESAEDTDIAWALRGDSKWHTTDALSYYGERSLRSGYITAGQRTSLEIDLDLDYPGILVFSYKTSTRYYQDLFHFYIDSLDYSATEDPLLWSGDNDWRTLSFNIRAGSRKLKWEYVRGLYTPGFEDAVWLDMIVLPDGLAAERRTETAENWISSYPNPFNPVTSITFDLERSGRAELLVFNSAGRLVSRLHDGELPSGRHGFVFDGSGLASGIYYSVLKFNGKIKTNKMILAK